MKTLDAPLATTHVNDYQARRLEIIRATSDEELDAVLEIRRRVFSDEQHMVDGQVSDLDDRRSVHALALWHDGERVIPVGTGRLTLGAGERGEALVSWVATLPEARRHGIGRSVMRYLIDIAEGSGAPLVALAAQTHAELFYRRLGFIGTGRTYMIRRVEHRWMIRHNHRLLHQRQA